MTALNKLVSIAEAGVKHEDNGSLLQTHGMQLQGCEMLDKGDCR